VARSDNLNNPHPVITNTSREIAAKLATKLLVIKVVVNPAAYLGTADTETKRKRWDTACL